MYLAVSGKCIKIQCLKYKPSGNIATIRCQILIPKMYEMFNVYTHI